MPGAAAIDSGDRTATTSAGARQAGTEGTQDPATFEGEFCVRAPKGNTLPAEKYTHTYYSSAGGSGRSSDGRSSRGLALVEGRLGEALFAEAAGAVTVAEVQCVTGPTPCEQTEIIQVLMDRKAAAGKASPQTTSPTPLADFVDWWRLAAYFSAATGFQEWWPANKRFGDWSALFRA